MNKLIDDGVDGLITDYPDRLREVLADRGFALPTAYQRPAQATPLQPAHAHNDYEHKRPLHDALDHGFTSVEADVWLVDGELLVAHDRAAMLAQPVRYAGYDGRLSDLDSQTPASFMPLVSDNWTKNFTWTGNGPMPAAEEQKLRDIVTTAHQHGYRVRFWATPEAAGPARNAVWAKLLDVGADQLNTDDLDGLQRFLAP